VYYRLDQIAEYCERAAAQGVTELALTEHSHRFVDVMNTVGNFWERQGHEPTAPAMAAYFDWHSHNSIEEYVTLAQRAKDEGLPVKIGLEVDYFRGQMDVVSDLLAQYPFDVLIGSVHWLGTWQFDDLDNPLQQAEWDARGLESCWRDYTTAFEELAATKSVDVMAHPDLIKVAGRVVDDPSPWWDAMAQAALKADVSIECSSAGWFKPMGEQYPAEGFLERLVRGGATFTMASDAHQSERVGARANDIAAMLERHGVHELATYEGRQRVMKPLRSH
jgi:histidinol-phosphatase (PHP family)